MSYEFKTELFGTVLEVTGEFSPEEPRTFDYEGCQAGFEIDTIRINKDDIEIDLFSDLAISLIVEAAFDAAVEEAKNSADEYASQLAEDRANDF